MSPETRCVLCGQGDFVHAAQVGRVRSNLRQWRDERFTVWRCAACHSLSSLEPVDLERYYQGYVFGRRQLDGFTRKVFGHLLRQLRRHGLDQGNRVLDFGCGAGVFVTYLRAQWVAGAVGYDAHVPGMNDPEVLRSRYDLVLAQDVIEHVEDPGALLRELAALCEPGGTLWLSTPRAEGIDLAQVEAHVHSLHQPFHRHILSERALRRLATEAGLELIALRRRSSVDTPHPFVNYRFLMGYLRTQDNCLDAGFDPPDFSALLRRPALLALGLLGALRDNPSEMIAVLRAT